MFGTLKLWLFAGVALVIAGLAATVFYYRGNAISAHAKTAAIEAQRDQLQRDLNEAVGVNKENQETIDKMVSEGLRRDHIIVGMADEIHDINLELLDKTEALNRAKEADADVAKYLAQPIPDALRKLRVDPKAAPAPSGRQN